MLAAEPGAVLLSYVDDGATQARTSPGVVLQPQTGKEHKTGHWPEMPADGVQVTSPRIGDLPQRSPDGFRGPPGPAGPA